jgi:hypothetical protein
MEGYRLNLSGSAYGERRGFVNMVMNMECRKPHQVSISAELVFCAYQNAALFLSFPSLVCRF